MAGPTWIESYAPTPDNVTLSTADLVTVNRSVKILSGPPPRAFEHAERVRLCSDYEAHRPYHRRVGDVWVCDRCEAIPEP